MNEKLKNHKTYTKALYQLDIASNLLGLIEPVIGMPDLTPGHGLPVGSVLATNAENGVISLNAIGGDINCGISLSRTNINKNDLLNQTGKLDEKYGKNLSEHLKSNLASNKEVKLENIMNCLIHGAKSFCDDELNKIENYGVQPVHNKKIINNDMISIARNQIGTLGGGNHFIDLLHIEEIYDEELGTLWDLERENIFFMLHTGSRGLGNYTRENYVENIDSNETHIRRLKPVLFNSTEGRNILDCVNVASNFAYANRSVLRKKILNSLKETAKSDIKSNLIYDFGHNNISLEEMNRNQIILHRKGASKGLPAGHEGNTVYYKETGHPIIIPGSLGSATYVLVATDKLNETFYSINHGAGRKYPRGYVEKKKNQPRFNQKIDTYVNLPFKHYCQEVPNAYKDIEEVIKTLEDNEFVRKIAKLKPIYAYLEKK